MKQMTTCELARILSCCGVGLVAPIITSTAAGQSTQDNSMLEEVIVTAQKREQSLQDTPISIASFNNADVEKLGITNLHDIASAVPNLDIRQTTNSSAGARVYIRGIGVNDHVVTLDGAVGIYMDGVYLARNTGLAFDVADIERIEVLRGPQGSLWGRNTTGGAINFISKLPTGEFGFKQTVDIGNYDLVRTNSQIEAPLTEQLSAKLSLLYEDKEGWVENRAAGVDFGDQENLGTRLALNWVPSEQLQIDYAYDYSQSDFGSNYYQNGTPFNAAFAGVPFSRSRQENASPSVPYQESDFEIEGHGLTVLWDLGPSMQLKSISSYREMEQHNYTDNGANPVSTRIFSNDPFDVDQSQVSQELQLLGSAFNDELQYTTGLYYFREEGEESNADFVSLTTAFEFQIYDRFVKAENSAWAAYGEMTWTPAALSDRLHLTAGARYSVDKREIQISNNLLEVQTPESAGGARDDWSNLSPSFVLAYDVSDHSNAYIKYVHGYRTGGFNGRAGTVREAIKPVDEENLVSYELGLKSEWFDRRLRINTAVFVSDYEDVQLSLVDNDPDAPPGAVARINAGEAELSGIELDITAALSDRLRIHLAYAYLDSEFVEVIDPISGDDISDIYLLVGAPETSYNADLDYTIGHYDWGHLSANLNYAWRDSRNIKTTELEVGDPVGSYGLWNARLSLTEWKISSSGALGFALWIRNLTDEEYQLDGFGLPTTGSTLVTYGEPRTYGVQLSYTFE
ncbi:MAG: TonB-dependent receptor [Halioglobus sp.]